MILNRKKKPGTSDIPAEDRSLHVYHKWLKKGRIHIIHVLYDQRLEHNKSTPKPQYTLPFFIQ